MKNEKRGRVWLNPIDSYDTGSLNWSISYHKGDEYFDIFAKIAIRDCSRSVELNFDCGIGENDVSIAERINKFNILINHITKIRDLMVEIDINKDKIEKELEVG